MLSSASPILKVAPEVYISATRAREVIAGLKGGTRIGYPALRRLIRDHGLPTFPDPCGGANPVFLESAILAWDQARRAKTAPLPIRRGPGRPAKHSG